MLLTVHHFLSKTQEMKNKWSKEWKLNLTKFSDHIHFCNPTGNERNSVNHELKMVKQS